MEPYIAAAVVYLILTMIATKLLNKFGEHFDAKGERVVLGTSDVPVAKAQGGDEK